MQYIQCDMLRFIRPPSGINSS